MFKQKRMIFTGQIYCPPVWDGWGCWNYTVAGANAATNCRAYKIGFDSLRKFIFNKTNLSIIWDAKYII